MKVPANPAPENQLSASIENRPVINLKNGDATISIDANDFLGYVATAPTSGGGEFVAFSGNDPKTGKVYDVIRHNDGIRFSANRRDFEIPQKNMEGIAREALDLQQKKPLMIVLAKPVILEKQVTPELIAKWCKKISPFIVNSPCIRTSAAPRALWFKLDSKLGDIKAFGNTKVQDRNLQETVDEILNEMRQVQVKVDSNVIKRGVVLDGEYNHFVAKYPELGSFVESCKEPDGVTGIKVPRPFGYLALPEVLVDMVCKFNQIPTVSPFQKILTGAKAGSFPELS